MCEYIAHIKGNRVQTCTEHCRQTGEYTASLLKPLGLEKTGYICGITHDCGKFTQEFLDYINAAANGEDVIRGEVIHTFAAVRLFLNQHSLFNEHAQDADENRNTVCEVLACAVGSHHGQFDCFDPNHNCGFSHRYETQPEYDTQAIEHFFDQTISKEDFNNLFSEAEKEICNKFEELATLSEYNNEIYFHVGLLVRLIQSALIDSDRRDTAEFSEDLKYPEIGNIEEIWSNSLESLENRLNSFNSCTPICKARSEISNLCKQNAEKAEGIYRLNLPTGAGKTLSGLRFALAHAKTHKKDRIFCITPLLSILDQNAQEIRKSINNDGIILEHHSNIITESMDIDELDEYEYYTETWNAPIILTTLVQFLNTLFSGKTSSIRRFHSLCNSVVIIDEVQTVPNKMLTLFNLALNFLAKICHVTFVLCSATQPCLEATTHPLMETPQDIITPKELEKYKDIFARTKIERAENLSLEQIPEFLEEQIKDCSSLLIVCNKKKESEYLYSQLSAKNYKRFHLSASMCMAHRKKVLEQIKECLKKNEKVICVSTQVIEAGVDISFAKAIRLSAGIDSIVQTAGRCNRNGESKELAPVYILNCTDENLEYLREIQMAKDATEELLAEYAQHPDQYNNDISSTESINYYYERLYNGMNQNYQDFYSDDVKQTIYSLLSENDGYRDDNALPLYVGQAFKTAGRAFKVFDTEQQSIIVPYEEGEEIINELQAEGIEYDPKRMRSLLNRAKPYTISVFLEQLGDDVIYKVCDGKVNILSPECYDENTGLTRQNGNLWNTLIL